MISRALPGVGKAMSRRQAAAYERSGGTKSSSLMGKPTFRLTVRGRKSGEPRSVMLMLVRDGDDLIVIGSQAGVDRRPELVEEPDGRRRGRRAGRGGVLAGSGPGRSPTADERERAWGLACAVYPDFDAYQQLTERRIPVAALERVEPRPPADRSRLLRICASARPVRGAAAPDRPGRRRSVPGLPGLELLRVCPVDSAYRVQVALRQHAQPLRRSACGAGRRYPWQCPGGAWLNW